jgi:hypothetical protein
MNNPENIQQPGPDDADALIQRLLDADLSADEQRRLLQSVMGSAECCEDFALQLFLHSALEREATCLSDEEFVRSLERPAGSEREKPASLAPIMFDESQLPSRWPWFAGGSLFAFCLCAVAMMFFSPSGQSRLASEGQLPGSVLRSERADTQPARAAAYLTLANGCDWGGGAAEFLAVGKSIEMGDEITLYEGIAEFRLASGVALSIEGPTTLVMASVNSLFLQHGRVTAYVPWAASDFRLVTSACRLTASDAEFGVDAKGGEVSIHAFSGEVLAVPEFTDSKATEISIAREQDLAAGSEFLATTIVAGRGLELVSQGDVTRVSRWHPADKDHFATKLTMAGPLPITSQYVDSVLKSKPISYWRFESRQDEQIANEVPAAAALKIFGDLRLAGESTNRVAELGRPGSDGYLLSEDALTFPSTAEYSLEAWLKPSHLHTGTPVLLLADFALDGKERAAFLLQSLGSKQDVAIKHPYPGRIRFLHRNPPGPRSDTGTSCFSSSSYLARRWHHVVATKDQREMRLFIDGALVATANDQSPLANNLHVVVGQLGKSQRLQPFVGQLDELAIYARALSQDEIGKRLKILKWKPESRKPSRRDDA